MTWAHIFLRQLSHMCGPCVSGCAVKVDIACSECLIQGFFNRRISCLDATQITSSQHLDAKKVLLRVPMEAKDFLETRALLLERLGRHQDALE